MNFMTNVTKKVCPEDFGYDWKIWPFSGESSRTLINITNARDGNYSSGSPIETAVYALQP